MILDRLSEFSLFSLTFVPDSDPVVFISVCGQKSFTACSMQLLLEAEAKYWIGFEGLHVYVILTLCSLLLHPIP